MPIGFLKKVEEIPDHRVARNGDLPSGRSHAGGALCGADDFEAIELLSREYLVWLKQLLRYKGGIPRVQTFRKVFRLLKPEVLERCFAAWVASLQDSVRGVVAVTARRCAARRKRRTEAGLCQAGGLGIENNLQLAAGYHIR